MNKLPLLVGPFLHSSIIMRASPVRMPEDERYGAESSCCGHPAEAILAEPQSASP